MTSPVPPEDAGGTGPFGQAVADMRATAKWTIGAVAAVGALLLGGGPLAAMGKINDMGDAAAAFGGLALALAGVGWVIWQTGEVLAPRLSTITELDRPSMAELRRRIAQDPTPFYGPFGEDPASLRAARVLHEKAVANLAAIRAREQDENRIRSIEQAFDDEQANAALARRLEHQLVDLVHAWQVHTALRRARVHTLAALAVVAFGAVLFLTATIDNPPEPSTKPTPTATR